MFAPSRQKFTGESLYKVIWERIKKTGSCKCQVKPQFVARVKKAVITKKTQDLGWKLVNDHAFFYLKISYTLETQVLVFRLTHKYDGILPGQRSDVEIEEVVLEYGI
jgi:hypothetical protein